MLFCSFFVFFGSKIGFFKGFGGQKSLKKGFFGRFLGVFEAFLTKKHEKTVIFGRFLVFFGHFWVIFGRFWAFFGVVAENAKKPSREKAVLGRTRQTTAKTQGSQKINSFLTRKKPFF